jgi:glycosyltransferase involved in cell wall biosynthesis
MKNILFISHDSVPYGAPKSMLNIIDGLKNDVNFTVLLPYQGAIVDELEKNKVKWYISRYYWNVYNLSSLKDFIFFPYRLLRHFYSCIKTICIIMKLHKHQKFDAIHSNSGVIRVGFYAAKFLSIPHIWHIREFQTKDYNLNILFGIGYLKKLFSKSDKIICVSEAIKNYFGLEKSSVIYNGVMPTPTNNVLFEKENYFIFAASLFAKKGIYDLLAAFADFSEINPSINLIVCGTGDEENTSRITTIINNLGLQHRIQLYGYRSDLLELLRKAKACIVPSHSEAFGRITAEAMLMDCPVIGNSTEGTLEIIKDERYGYLYESQEELIKHMVFLSEFNNKEKIESKIISAKERAIEMFTQEKICDETYRVYQDTIIQKKIKK